MYVLLGGSWGLRGDDLAPPRRKFHKRGERARASPKKSVTTTQSACAPQVDRIWNIWGSCYDILSKKRDYILKCYTIQ